MPQQPGIGQSYPVLPDTRVDQLVEQDTGVIDELADLSTASIPDIDLIKNLESRLKDSQDYWNSPQGFNLTNVRRENTKLYLGDHLNLQSLYRFQIPYIENQVYVAEQAILAYLTASPSEPEVTPSSDKPQSKKFGSDAEKILVAHGFKKSVRLQQKAENLVKNAMNKRIGVMYLEYDEQVREIIPYCLNPEEVIFDKNAKQGDNNAIIGRNLKMSANEMCHRWPKKARAIHKAINVPYKPRKESSQAVKDQKMDMILDIRQVHVTEYDREFEPQESVVYYFGDLVLERSRNPNWLYASPERNFLDAPFKSFIPLNFDNDGEHWIDNTSAIEQAGKLQFILNRRGRQMMELADKANGVLVLDTRVTGIQMTDAQDLTRDPNQVIVINTPAGASGQEGLFELPPAQIPSDLYQDKIDLRTQIYTMMGAPTDFSGAEDVDGGDDTLGQSQMKKDQANGRQDLYVRAIDRFWDAYFNMLYQMMIVWYDEKHYSVYNGGDGEFDYLTASRDTLDNTVGIQVKSGSVLPFDKKRLELVVMALLKIGDGKISLLDAYKFLHLPNPQQLYDNLAKQQTDPMALARDALDEGDETKAYVAYVEIMNGKKPDSPDDCTKEFILTLRKIMIRDDFLKADDKYKKAFLEYYEKALSSLELRTSLDIMSKEGIQLLEPQQPVQPLPPPQMMPMPGQAPPPGMPGQQPPPPGMQPPGMSPQGQPSMQGAMPQSMGQPQPMQSAIPSMGQPQLPQM